MIDRCHNNYHISIKNFQTDDVKDGKGGYLRCIEEKSLLSE